MLKGMQELGLSPDVETLHDYIFPAFPSMAEALQALEVCVCLCVYVRVGELSHFCCQSCN